MIKNVKVLKEDNACQYFKTPQTITSGGCFRNHHIIYE